ncbi:hypothetical protein DENSPDRAFT_344377 [Dentipellis sp. KUC8613]|nr:hypothetical protein DENSPDRAFT_344377 [Dentipellis sp. KUC8613]
MPTGRDACVGVGVLITFSSKLHIHGSCRIFSHLRKHTPPNRTLFLSFCHSRILCSSIVVPGPICVRRLRRVPWRRSLGYLIARAIRTGLVQLSRLAGQQGRGSVASRERCGTPLTLTLLATVLVPAPSSAQEDPRSSPYRVLCDLCFWHRWRLWNGMELMEHRGWGRSCADHRNVASWQVLVEDIILSNCA